jgi:hypothetical protein
MNLQNQRAWITPLVIGAFLLSAVTGTLMFFHLDSGLNKAAHEWLSWAMLIGVGLHLMLNLVPFKRYFRQTTGRWIMAGFAAVLALSFIPAGGTAARVNLRSRTRSMHWPAPRCPLLRRLPA